MGVKGSPFLYAATAPLAIMHATNREIICRHAPVYTSTESSATPLAKSISITPEGNNEINTNPPKNVPRMLPAELRAESLPTTAPEELTFCIASLATNGETIPSRRLDGAKMTVAEITEAT